MNKFLLVSVVSLGLLLLVGALLTRQPKGDIPSFRGFVLGSKFEPTKEMKKARPAFSCDVYEQVIENDSYIGSAFYYVFIGDLVAVELKYSTGRPPVMFEAIVEAMGRPPESSVNGLYEWEFANGRVTLEAGSLVYTTNTFHEVAKYNAARRKSENVSNAKAEL